VCPAITALNYIFNHFLLMGKLASKDEGCSEPRSESRSKPTPVVARENVPGCTKQKRCCVFLAVVFQFEEQQWEGEGKV